jgi:hypothetical protein
VAELREAAVALRARADRLETSLTFLRDVATRLEGDDATAAAQGGLELAMGRIGARAGVVQISCREGLKTIASSGAWSPDIAAPDLFSDRTATAVLRNRRAVRAIDINDVGPNDSDLVAPIFDSRGAIVGLMALRGVPQGGASVAALHDLSLVAGWCAKSLIASQKAKEVLQGTATGALAREEQVTQVPLEVQLESSIRESLSDEPPRSISQLNL